MDYLFSKNKYLCAAMSQFIVSARKYRPYRFEDVVGQQHVAGTLKNALATGKVAHAFLFTGPRGVGKTTCARILAKVLNCQNPQQFEACNSCPSCTAFNENASFNIIELDAASNNSVEHIRALIEQVRFQPQQGKYKVFIIDEVHMLSNQAFNAFLKTLEEPPPYAIFILATTEKHKILPTILSRCQIFDFRRISIADTVEHLKKICVKENIQADEDALHIIAQKADGALRDALSIFDRMAGGANGQISYAHVIENLNVLDYDYYFQIVDGMMAEDMPAVLNLFDQILRKGFEPDIFVSGLGEHLRNILVCRDASTLALLEVGDSLRERYRKQAQLAPVSMLLSALNLVNDCDINFKMARNKRLHVEMALIKMVYLNRAIDASKRSAAPDSPEKKTADLKKTAPEPTSTDHLPPQTPPTTLAAPPTSQPPVSTSTPEPPRSLKKNTATALSLDAYEAEVIKEDSINARRVSRFDLENTVAVWKVLAEETDSQTLRLALQEAQLSVSDKILLIRTGSLTNRSLLQAESIKLINRLRQELDDPQITLQLELDEAKMEEIKSTQVVKRPLTTRDKFEKMREINPIVNDLVQRFELKPEE